MRGAGGGDWSSLGHLVSPALLLAAAGSENFYICGNWWAVTGTSLVADSRQALSLSHNPSGKISLADMF